jgi:tetratricopeptide (TPR) repeat protein
LLLLAVTAFGASVAGINLWADYHLRAARTALEHYHNHEAVGHLGACLQIWPRNLDCLLLAARAARRLNAFADAESFLERYRAARGSEDDNVMLEDILLLAQRGEVDTVRRCCQTLVEEDHPETPLILEAMTSGYIRQFRLHDALACLEDWQKRQPENPQAFFLKGRVFDQGMNLGEAVVCYRRVLQLDGDYDDARLHLAGKLLDLAQADEALPHLRYLHRRLPDNPLVQVLLARCRAQLGQAAQAEKLLDDLLARFPDDVMALAERGSLALQRGQNAAAEAWLSRAVEQAPGNYQAYYSWYLALTRLGRTDEAGKVQKHLEEMKRDLARIQEIVTRQMQEKPHDPALHYEAGQIALRAGAMDEGVRWLESALKEDPGYEPAHKALADFFERVGSPGRAAQHRRAAEAARRRQGSRALP